MTAAVPLAPGQSRFLAIDALRVCAALTVAIFHYQHFLSAADAPDGLPDLRVQPLFALLGPVYLDGQLAVQVFWLISGFVIAHAYLADPAARQRFWPARVARLWPLHLLTLAVVFVLEQAHLRAFGDFLVYSSTWADVPRNALLLQVWWPPIDFTINGPTWSLSAEVAAYAAFWLALPWLRRAPLAGAVVACGLALLLRKSGAAPWPLTSALIYVFAGGAAYGAVMRGLAGRWLVLSALALAALAALPAVRAGAPGMAVLMAFVIAPFCLAAGLDLALPAPGPRLAAALRRAGDATYGIYLWHVPIQLALVLSLGGTQAMQPLVRQPWFLGCYLALVLAAGLASHRWIERPAQGAVLRLFAARRRFAPA